jgi:hypothetical protein
MHVYEVRPRKDKRGVDLISDVLPFGRLWYDTPDNAIGYALHSSRSHDAVVRVYAAAGNVIETHEHAGGFKGTVTGAFPSKFASHPGHTFVNQNFLALAAKAAQRSG